MSAKPYTLKLFKNWIIAHQSEATTFQNR